MVIMSKIAKNNCASWKKNKKTINCIDNLRRQDYNKYIIK